MRVRLILWSIAVLFAAQFDATAQFLEEAARPTIHRMRRISVESDAIETIGYHRKTRTLEVAFRTGDVYRYASVPRETFLAFLAAESKGRYFQKRIRGRYPFWRVPRSRVRRHVTQTPD